jgi:hypothetical protein
MHITEGTGLSNKYSKTKQSSEFYE